MIYILKYATGEYEDYVERPLCYFDDKDEAERMFDKGNELLDYLNKRAYEFIENCSSNYNVFYQETIVQRYLSKLGLQHLIVDYTGLGLLLEEVEDFRSSTLGYLTEVKYNDII